MAIGGRSARDGEGRAASARGAATVCMPLPPPPTHSSALSCVLPSHARTACAPRAHALAPQSPARCGGGFPLMEGVEGHTSWWRLRRVCVASAPAVPPPPTRGRGRRTPCLLFGPFPRWVLSPACTPRCPPSPFASSGPAGRRISCPNIVRRHTSPFLDTSFSPRVPPAASLILCGVHSPSTVPVPCLASVSRPFPRHIRSPPLRRGFAYCLPLLPIHATFPFCYLYFCTPPPDAAMISRHLSALCCQAWPARRHPKKFLRRRILGTVHTVQYIH